MQQRDKAEQFPQKSREMVENLEWKTIQNTKKGSRWSETDSRLKSHPLCLIEIKDFTSEFCHIRKQQQRIKDRRLSEKYRSNYW